MAVLGCLGKCDALQYFMIFYQINNEHNDHEFK